MLAHSSFYTNMVPSHLHVALPCTVVLFRHWEYSAEETVKCNLTLGTRQINSRCLGSLDNCTVNKETESHFFSSFRLWSLGHHWHSSHWYHTYYYYPATNVCILHFSGQRGCPESREETWPVVRGILKVSGSLYSNSHPREPAQKKKNHTHTKFFWAHEP